MAKKAKKGKKKGKGGSSDSSVAFVSAHKFHEKADSEKMASTPDSWLLIDLALTNWVHMRFKVLAHVDNSFLWLSRLIQERTGSIDTLTLYRDPPIPANEIPLTTPSFRSLGLNGGPRTSPTSAKLFYDFKPRLSSDSLLLTEPITWSITGVAPGKDSVALLSPDSKTRRSDDSEKIF